MNADKAVAMKLRCCNQTSTRILFTHFYKAMDLNKRKQEDPRIMVGNLNTGNKCTELISQDQ